MNYPNYFLCVEQCCVFGSGFFFTFRKLKIVLVSLNCRIQNRFLFIKALIRNRFFFLESDPITFFFIMVFKTGSCFSKGSNLCFHLGSDSNSVFSSRVDLDPNFIFLIVGSGNEHGSATLRGGMLPGTF